MATRTAPTLRSRSCAPPSHLRHERLLLDDGARTTLHVARHDPRRCAVHVVRLPTAVPLEAHCRAHGIEEALVGGFYRRPDLCPLGELHVGGAPVRHVPFDTAVGPTRACVQVDHHHVSIGRRDRFAARPTGDLLQAGPLLVSGGAVVEGDPEGFSAGSHQFDSDITDGRHPRAAIGVTARGEGLAGVCDGRADDEAGLTMGELAGVMADLGAVEAMNLDGGGSASLVCGGRLRNVPRRAHGQDLPGGRAVPTAIVFLPR